MAKNITIYTTSTCAFCLQVEKWLTAKGLAFTEINLDEHPEKREELLQVSGQMAVPVTVVADDDSDQHDMVVGWNLAKLIEVTKDMLDHPAEAA
jgi:glutaredoxin 3